VLWLLEVVADEDELTRPVEVLDGEDAPEDGLQADLRPIVLRYVRLQELVVRRLLDVDEVRNLDDFPDASKMLADAEVGLDDVRHRCSWFSRWPLARATAASTLPGRATRGTKLLGACDAASMTRRRMGRLPAVGLACREDLSRKLARVKQKARRPGPASLLGGNNCAND